MATPSYRALIGMPTSYSLDTARRRAVSEAREMAFEAAEMRLLSSMFPTIGYDSASTAAMTANTTSSSMSVNPPPGSAGSLGSPGSPGAGGGASPGWG